MRVLMIAWMVFALLLVGLSIGHAADRDETVVTALVSSADHVEEGYFSPGPGVTVLAKPGTELHRFLASENGRRVRLTPTVVGGPQLTKLER